MVPTRGPRTPSGFHFFVSIAVGAALPVFAHLNKPVELVLLLAFWVGIQLFMHLRARAARGIFIDETIAEFSWSGTGGFVAGLLIASAFFVAYG